MEHAGKTTALHVHWAASISAAAGQGSSNSLEDKVAQVFFPAVLLCAIYSSRSSSGRADGQAKAADAE